MAKLYFISLLAISMILGCTGGSGNSGVQFVSPTTPSGTNGSTTPPTSPTVTTSAPLALSIYTIYDDSTAVYNQTFQETGTTTCQATTGTPNVTCTINVPEGRLYYSSLNFSFSWTTSACKLLIAQPYYYKASTSATYLAPSATSTVDCSGASGTPTAACYGGVAPTLVPSFPTYTSFIYLPNEAITSGPQSKVLSMPSGYSLHTNSNRTVVNDMPSGDYASDWSPTQVNKGVNPPNGGDGYVHGSMVNYTFSCRDDWYDPTPAGASYTIHLVVKDVNDDPTGTQTEDDFYTWAEITP